MCVCFSVGVGYFILRGATPRNSNVGKYSTEIRWKRPSWWIHIYFNRESLIMTTFRINRRETDLTTFHLKSQRKSQAKKEKKEKRERERLGVSGSSPTDSATAATAADATRFSSLFRLSPFILISSLPSAFVYSFGRASYLKIYFFFLPSLFLDFSCVGFSFYWDTFFFCFLFSFDLSTVI